ncbi:phosphatidylserine decarboxylase [Vibrio cholerae]|nr:phosphatidylserine decarboxylase [Vibrio cholerae]
MRPIAEGEKVITHPADACVSQFGAIDTYRAICSR